MLESSRYTLSSESRTCPWGLSLPCATQIVLPMGASSFESYFLGQTFRRLLFTTNSYLFLLALQWFLRCRKYSQRCWGKSETLTGDTSSVTKMPLKLCLPSHPFHFLFADCLQTCPQHNQFRWELEFKSSASYCCHHFTAIPKNTPSITQPYQEIC